MSHAYVPATAPVLWAGAPVCGIAPANGHVILLFIGGTSSEVNLPATSYLIIFYLPVLWPTWSAPHFIL